MVELEQHVPVHLVYRTAFTSVDGRALGDGRPGRLTLALRDLYWSKRAAGWLGTPIT